MANTVKVIPIPPIAWWAMIHMKELYKGEYEINPPDDINMERRIPRVGWWVCDEAGFYRVNQVHKDNTSVLGRIYPNQSEDYANVITGPAVHQYTTPFRIMVDPTTTPVRFRIDDAMIFRGSEPLYYKIFKGSDTTINGKVISTAVDGSGKPTDANLLLETVQGANSANDLIKVARGGHLLELVANQEMCTVMAYRADGLQVDYREAVVCHTTNLAPLDMAKRTILGISIETPFLNRDNPRIIDVPVNMLIDSTVIMGVVTYNDGTIKRLPINGEKFSLNGYENFTSTTAGAMYDVGLSYTLSGDEQAWDALGNIPVPAVTEEYKMRAINPDGNYTAKLFAVPKWNSTAGRYDLNWYLYNMERKYVYDVTGKVEFTPGFSFNGTQYASKQSLRVAINMGDVDSYFINYRHVANLDINLINPGSAQNQATYYQISYDDQYTYGTGVRVDTTVSTTQVNTFNLNIANGCATVDEWLNKCYYPTEPLFYTSAEDMPPNPTEVRLRNLSTSWERTIEIDDVLKPITGVNLPVKQGDCWVLEFAARTSTELLQLSLGSMNNNMYTN